MNGLFNNTPQYELPSQAAPADGGFESFLNELMATDEGGRQAMDGESPQRYNWDLWFPQPRADSTLFQPDEISLADYEMYEGANIPTLEPNMFINHYGSEGTTYAGYGSVGDTVYPPDTLYTHSHPNHDSVDDPPGRQTEQSSSVPRTDQNYTIKQRGSSFFPSPPLDGSLVPDVCTTSIAAPPSPSPVPSLGNGERQWVRNYLPGTIVASIAASKIRRRKRDSNLPSHCLLEGCATSSGPPKLTPRHMVTDKHCMQLSAEDRATDLLHCPHLLCTYTIPYVRRDAFKRHKLSCASRHLDSRHLDSIERGGRTNKRGRPRGSKNGGPKKQGGS